MSALARWCLRHRRLVIVFWILVFAAGLAAAGRTDERLSNDFSLPGQPSHEAAQKLREAYGTESLGTPFLVVLTAPAGELVDDAQAAEVFADIARRVPGVRVIGGARTDPVFVADGGRAQFAYVFYPPATGFDFAVLGDVENAVAAATPTPLTGELTGFEPLAAGDGEGSGIGVLAETLIAAVGALAVLAFVFASLLALVPLVVAAVSILTTFLVLLGLTYLVDVSFFVSFLVALVGLGVAIDYSLLMVTRWREERDHGRDNHDAVVAAAATAGHAVVFSGLTVAVSLLALIAIPTPFLRSIGYGGMLIPLVSVAVTTTLLPAVLGSIGPRVDWPRIRTEGSASRFWTAWSNGVVRRRGLAAAAGAVILAALFLPVFGIQLGSPTSASLAQAGPAHEALQTLRDGGLPAGVLTPAEILVEQGAADSVAEAARGVDGVATAFAPDGPAANRDGTTVLLAIPESETVGGASTEVIDNLRATLQPVPGVIGISGLGALQLDWNDAVYGSFPLALGLIVGVTYVLLVRAFRSLLLPFKALVLNVASIGATFGAMVLFWQDGWGSEPVYGIEAVGAVSFWLPILVFAFLFGLSMDYEVFILARIREEYDASGDTDAAVVEGVGRTGRLVTSAALILFLAFLSLSTGPQTELKMFATALGFGILLDATVVRMLLVPALVSLFGRWNWYLPGWVATLLRVAPSPPRPAALPRQPVGEAREAADTRT